MLLSRRSSYLTISSFNHLESHLTVNPCPMMYPSPSTSIRIRGSQLQPLTPSQRLNRCLSPLGGDGRHQDPVKFTTSLFPPLPTASPLPRIISDPTPPVPRLTAL